MTIKFYTTKDDYGEFSNFYGVGEDKNFNLVIDGHKWPTTEHYYQAQKFLGANTTTDSKAYAEAILATDTPSKAFVLARQKNLGGYQALWKLTKKGQTLLKDLIANSLAKGVKMRPDWDSIKDEVMYKALQAKFGQNPHLLKKLMGTGDQIIIENSPRDSYWGIGKDGKGLNRLGELLMKIRQQTLLLSVPQLSPPIKKPIALKSAKKKIPLKKTASPNVKVISTCHGLTASGQPCTRKGSYKAGNNCDYCWQHQPHN